MKFFLLLIVVSLFAACSSNRKIQFTRVNKVKTVKNTESNRAVHLLTNDPNDGSRKLIEFKMEESESILSIDSVHCVEVEHNSEKFNQRFPYKPSTLEAPVQPKKYNKPAWMTLKKAKTKSISTWFAIWAGTLGVFMGLVLATNKRSALKISSWAKKNRRKSIGLIAVIKVTLGATGFYAGNAMFNSDLLISSTVTHSLVSIIALTALMYPRKNARFGLFKHTYLRQKMHDIAFSLCGVLLMASIGNQAASNQNFLTPLSSTISSSVNTFKGSTSILLKNGSQNSSSPSIKFENSTPSRTQGKSSDTRIVANVFITLLLIVATVFLALLLGALVCNLSCSGQEVLATIVAIAGPIVLITLFILALKAIWKKDTEQIE